MMRVIVTMIITMVVQTIIGVVKVSDGRCVHAACVQQLVIIVIIRVFIMVIIIVIVMGHGGHWGGQSLGRCVHAACVQVRGWWTATWALGGRHLELASLRGSVRP